MIGCILVAYTLIAAAFVYAGIWLRKRPARNPITPAVAVSWEAWIMAARPGEGRVVTFRHSEAEVECRIATHRKAIAMASGEGKTLDEAWKAAIAALGSVFPDQAKVEYASTLAAKATLLRR